MFWKEKLSYHEIFFLFKFLTLHELSLKIFSLNLLKSFSMKRQLSLMYTGNDTNEDATSS